MNENNPIVRRKSHFLWTVILILLSWSSVNTTVYAGTQNGKKITLNVEYESLSEVFKQIWQQTQYTFVYSTKELDDSEKVSIQASDLSVDEILDVLLTERDLKYKVVDQTVVITKNKQQASQQQPNRIIKGQVLDSKTKEPLPGANILDKYGRKGTVTDIDGNFSIEVPASGVVLVVTFIGYEPQEIPIRQDDEYTVYLDEDMNEIGQVVVTGYQEIKKERMTGSVSGMSAHEIAQTGAVTIDQAIRGQMAGVSSISTTGRPGASTQIRIRGLNSITGDMNPVWIVDGVEMQGAVPSVGIGGVDLQNNLFTDGIGNIPPEDIASITVLKDAAATAIYGARAANGVIVIETKKGVAGQKTMSLSAQWGVDMAPRSSLQMMNSAQKVQLELNLYNDNQNLSMAGRAYLIAKNMDNGVITPSEGEEMLNKLRNTNTDWLDVIFRPAFYQQYSMTFRGGDEKMNYYVSGNIRDTQGTLQGNENTNFSATFKINYKVYDKLQIETGFRGNLRKDDYPTTATGMDPFQYAIFANPYEKPYNEDGSYAYDRSYQNGWYLGDGNYEYDYNILQDLADGNKHTQANSATFNIKATWDIFNFLSAESLYSYSFSNNNVEDWASPGSIRSIRNGWLSTSNTISYAHENNNGFLKESSGRNNEWQLRNLLTFNRTIAEKHFINAMVGMEMAQSLVNSFYNMMPEYYPNYRLGGYPNLDLPLTSFDLDKLGGSYFNENKRLSYFTTGSYSFDDRYVASASIRYDGVNTVANTNNFTPLWNTSFKWNAHNESFLDNSSIVDVLSFRFGYGYTGSIDRTALPFSVLNYSTLYSYDNVYVPNNINWSNPDIKWQKKLDRNLGLDFGLLRNKINGSLNYYNNKVEDLLGVTYLPNSSGLTSVRANVASLVNKGYEISLNARVYERNDLSFTANFNIAHNFNEILESENKKPADLGMVSKQQTVHYVQGYEVGTIFGYNFAGVDPLTGNTLVYVNDDSFIQPWQIHSEINGRKVVDFDKYSHLSEIHQGTLSKIGSGYPPVNGGFGLNARYKGWSLASQFTYSMGHYIRSINNNKIDLERFNQNTIVTDLNHWREPGDIAPLPQLRDGAYRNTYAFYLFDTDYEKGDFLKMASISLSYNVPQNIIKDLNINRLKVGITGMNLATWTKYKGLDPEGLGTVTYPNPVRIIGNLSVEF